MPPSAEPPRRRLRRADTHFNELDGILSELRKQYPDAAVFKLDPESPPTMFPDPAVDGRGLLRVTAIGATQDIPLPDGIEEVVGDIVQNIRIALDYLVYQLAWLDSTAEQEGTQFPIFWSRRRFREKEPVYLRGVNDAHRYAIELLQPYNGGKWLGTMASLANPDKHTTFLRVGPGANIVVRHSVTPTPDDPEAGTLVDMHVSATPTVLLSDRRAVDEALRSLQSSIASVIDEFDPCFDGRCSHPAPPVVPQGPTRRSRRRRS